MDNLLSPELDAIGIWNSMQLTLSQHRPIKNSIIRIELNPSPEHTSFYDIEDWQKLWHGHPGCKYAYTPKSNTEFWVNKISGNQERDAVVKRELEESGWRVIIV